jgi:hypothetical protein
MTMANFNCVSWQRPKKPEETHVITITEQSAAPQPSIDIQKKIRELDPNEGLDK